MRRSMLRFGPSPHLNFACSFCLVAASLASAWAGEAIVRKSQSGPVSVEVRLEPAKPLIGDIVTLTITAVAEKNVELLMPEFGEALDRFSIVDFVPRESIDDRGRTVAVQKYRLQPPSSGPQAIPPILVEYVDRRPGQRQAPEDYDAYELLTERIDFAVQSVIPTDAKADLKPPLGRLEPLGKPPAPRWPWVAGGLFLLAIAGPLAARGLVAWRRRARRRSAYEIAKARLERLLARPRPNAEQLDAFYVELSGWFAVSGRPLRLRPPNRRLRNSSRGGRVTRSLARHQALPAGILRQADLVKICGARHRAK